MDIVVRLVEHIAMVFICEVICILQMEWDALAYFNRALCINFNFMWHTD